MQLKAGKGQGGGRCTDGGGSAGEERAAAGAPSGIAVEAGGGREPDGRPRQGSHAAAMNASLVALEDPAQGEGSGAFGQHAPAVLRRPARREPAEM